MEAHHHNAHFYTLRSPIPTSVLLPKGQVEFADRGCHYQSNEVNTGMRFSQLVTDN